ncbi:peroxiredoxin [Stakelama sediminis]|uniref:Alkyl hydroperoxide reductase C n=1 Tax=Stakelama sediminis TaxID=463200 RepID=A0A840Z0T2_9SPHN|nr:peroxiredoxin (alkyl hydroperoxide reductase subunit C) [Stakelama sediminis]
MNIPSASPAPLRLGDEVPSFTARSTQGTISLSDYRGRWLVLFAHPADFTPVCTSEFVALAQAADRFAALDCALVAMSVDSLYSHLAWLRLIHDRFGVRVDFPVVEDPSLEIARAYGMIAPDAADAGTARTTYFIDPNGILRACTDYPATIGRSVEEMLRVVEALQRVESGKCLAPANWSPGSALLTTPGNTADAALNAKGASDWFYSETPDRNRK